MYKRQIYVTNNKNFKTKNQIDFQYRKVGSYKVMNAIDKFILNYKRVEMEEDDNVLIDLLLDNFSKKIKTKGDAVQLIENYNSETRFNLSVYANKKIETIKEVGFMRAGNGVTTWVPGVSLNTDEARWNASMVEQANRRWFAPKLSLIHI